jgi:hypothetical protein
VFHIRNQDTILSTPCSFGLFLSDDLWVYLSIPILWERILSKHSREGWYPKPKSLRCDTFHCSALEKSVLCACHLANFLLLQIIPFTSLSLNALHRLRINLALFAIHDPISRDGAARLATTHRFWYEPHREKATLTTLFTHSCLSVLSVISEQRPRELCWLPKVTTHLWMDRRNLVRCFFEFRFTRYLSQPGIS